MREIAFAKVEEIMNTKPILMQSSETISSLIGRFRETMVYEILVLGSDKMGLVTIRDLLDTDFPERTKVENLMKITGSVQPDGQVIDAVGLMMRNRVRAVPVVEKGRVVGLLSQDDIVKALRRSPDLKEIAASEVMVSPIKTASMDSSVDFVQTTMVNNQFSHVPIVDKEGNLSGMVTAKDIVLTFLQPQERVGKDNLIGERIRAVKAPAHVLMDRNVTTAWESESLFSIVQSLSENKKSSCVVMKEGKPVGIITLREIMSLILRFKEDRGLPIYILGIDKEDLSFNVELARKKVFNVVRRNMRIHPNIEEVFVNIESRRKGPRPLYEVRARTWSAKGAIHAQAEGWDLPSVMDELAHRLDRRLKEAK